MRSMHEGLYELGRVDAFALQDTAVHRLDPRAKVLATAVFLLCVVSFQRYAVIPLAPFVLFPVMMAGAGRLPFSWLASRLLVAAPFALMVGMFNPLLDRAEVTILGATVAAGWISYLSIVARFALTTAAALALVGTTGMHGVCAALERMFVPDVFVVQLLFLYRYIFVLAEEGMRMSRARDLRSFGRRGRGLAVFGNILGHLLLRTFARAQRIHSAMQLRGFDGHVRSRRALRFGGRDAAFLAVWSALFVTLRLFDLPELLGRLIVGAVS